MASTEVEGKGCTWTSWWSGPDWAGSPRRWPCTGPGTRSPCSSAARSCGRPAPASGSRPTASGHWTPSGSAGRCASVPHHCRRAGGCAIAHGRPLLAVDQGAIEARAGAPLVVVDRTWLHRLLAAALPAGTVRTSAPVDSVHDDGRRVRLTVESAHPVDVPLADVEADLVVVADGAGAGRRPPLPRPPGLEGSGECAAGLWLPQDSPSSRFRRAAHHRTGGARLHAAGRRPDLLVRHLGRRAPGPRRSGARLAAFAPATPTGTRPSANSSPPPTRRR